MSERKIVVPEKLMNAALLAVQARLGDGRGSNWEDRARVAVEVALRWLSENPIVPSEEQAASLYGASLNIDYEKRYDATRAVVVEWQRRMFLAPPGEVPEEVKDLLTPRCNPNERWLPCNHDNAVIEAFRRGQKAGPR